MRSKNEGITKPRLESQEERENHQRERWVGKVLDVKEAKQQIILALPMILTNLFYYLIPIISVMFAGHLGKPQLAGATLANSWATVTGFAFMNLFDLVIGALALVQGLLVKSTTFGSVTRQVTLHQEVGLSGALETLCGQGYGAKLYKMLGIYLQASCIVSLVFSTIISLIWWFTEPILKLLHQTPEISTEAGIYMKYLIPGLFAYGALQNILRFLQMQSVVLPVVAFSLVPLLLHCGLTYLLVHCTTLGYKGAPLATSITFWVSVIILLIYVNFAKKFEHTWRGLSMESLSHVFTNLKLALPSAAMVCLEYWAFEILVFLAGLMPNPESSTSLIAMCVNTQASAYMFSYGLTAAVSTRVSNELGAGNTKQAKQAMGVALRLTILLVGIVLIFLGFGHDIWAGFFSGNPSIIKAYASMTTLVCISIFFDYFQSTLSGVCRGCGWQHLAVYINLGTFYLIGMPIACVLAFKFHFHAKGLWIGVLCGLIAQSFSLLLVTRLRKWTTIELPPSSTENFVV